uniref:Uncharacterized protein n=1 Tax=Kryptolebias marmoratus TaxID=37003 RepID=A0A3Q3AMB3_KRYMA
MIPTINSSSGELNTLSLITSLSGQIKNENQHFCREDKPYTRGEFKLNKTGVRIFVTSVFMFAELFSCSFFDIFYSLLHTSFGSCGLIISHLHSQITMVTTHLCLSLPDGKVDVTETD